MGLLGPGLILPLVVLVEFEVTVMPIESLSIS